MANNKANTKRQEGFWHEVISGPNGRLSSKRLLGASVLLVCLGCLTYLVVTEGGTQVVENVMQTFIIVACALLGIGSVTNAATEIFSEKKEVGATTKSDNTDENGNAEEGI